MTFVGRPAASRARIRETAAGASGGVLAVAARGAVGGQQALVLVVAQEAHFHARRPRKFADPHVGHLTTYSPPDGAGTAGSDGSGSPGQRSRIRAMASRSAAVTQSPYLAFTATWRAT